MAKKITIPVEVVGGEKSQQELEELKAKLQQFAEAQGGSAAKGEAAGQASKKAARGLVEVDDSAKTAAASLLNRVNPALGGTVEVLANVAKGAGSMSLGLLGIVGASAAIAGVAAVFGSLAERARKAAEAIEAARAARSRFDAERVKGQVGLADQLAQAGVFGQARGAAEDAAAIAQQLGVDRQLAEFGAVASRVGNLPAGNIRDLLAGFLATGQQATFGRDSRANRRTIQQLLRAGRSGAARAALAGRIEDVRTQALAEPPPGPPGAGANLDALLQRAAAAENLTDAQQREIAAIAGDVRDDRNPLLGIQQRNLGFLGNLTTNQFDQAVLSRSVDGRTLRDLNEIAMQVYRQFRALEAQRPAGGVMITVNNIGTAVQDLDVFRKPPSADYVELRP